MIDLIFLLFIYILAILFGLAGLIALAYGLYSLKIERFDKMVRIWLIAGGFLALIIAIVLYMTSSEY